MTDTYSTRWLREHLVALITRVDALEQGQRMNDEWHMAEAEVRSNFSHRIASLEERQYGHQCACGDAHVDTCQSCPPAATPEWRRLVTEQQWRIAPGQSPLSVVLHCLSRIDRNENGEHMLPTPDLLARIVAVCETEVGDGWQAEPGVVLTTYDDVERLLGALTAGSGCNYLALANTAAAWLRDITEGQS